MKFLDWFKPKSNLHENRLQNVVPSKDEKSALERYKLRLGASDGVASVSEGKTTGLERAKSPDFSDDPFAKFRTSKPGSIEAERSTEKPEEPPSAAKMELPIVEPARTHAHYPISASFGRRLVAEFTDFWILFVLIEVGKRMIGQFYPSHQDVSGITFLLNGFYSPIFMVTQFFYAGWFLSARGATPGKMLFELRVVDADSGQGLSFLRAGFRQVLGKWISGAPLCAGFLLALVRSDRKALHDFVFQSIVVKAGDTKA